MKRLYSIFAMACLTLLSGVAFSQSPVDIRINEVQVSNTNGIENESGERCGWVELFNTAYGMVDVAGFYLTDDKANPKKYMIPKGNVKTQIPLRQYFVLYADGNPQKGVFHMNFTLDGVKNLYLYATDGKTLLDEIEIPADLSSDRTFGRKVDGEGKHEPINWSKMSARKNSVDSKIEADGGFGILDHPTPGSTNITAKVETKSEKMKDMDPYGAILALTAMGTVFLCLIILYFCFRSIGKNSIKKAEAKKKASAQTSKISSPAKPVKITPVSSGNIDEEIIAAIAIACHMYQNGIDNTIHDVESNVLTFNQDILHNSPWGSKGLMQKQDPAIK